MAIKTKPSTTKLISGSFTYRLKNGSEWGEWSEWQNGITPIVINKNNQVIISKIKQEFTIQEIVHETDSLIEYKAIGIDGGLGLIIFEYRDLQAFVCIEGAAFMLLYSVNPKNFSLNPFIISKEHGTNNVRNFLNFVSKLTT